MRCSEELRKTKKVVLDVLLEDCTVDFRGLVVLVWRQRLYTPIPKCPHGGLRRASPFAEALGVNPHKKWHCSALKGVLSPM